MLKIKMSCIPYFVNKGTCTSIFTCEWILEVKKMND